MMACVTEPDEHARSDDPRAYDYSAPTREADIVMKGGVTSGVVYPHAICELARVFRFRSIGGTSAGAIAAALAAAAEYGRSEGGFSHLAELPDWIGRDQNLLKLFQPQAETARLFRLVIASLNKRWRYLLLPIALLRGFWPGALLGSLPAVMLALIVGFEATGAERVTGISVAAVLALAGGVVAALFAVTRAAARAIPENSFGLCTGMPGSAPAGAPALTPWLTAQLNGFAGRDRLLTFGDLEEHEIELAMMTTNLTNRSAHRLPLSSGRSFFFCPQEWRRLFPDEVVRWLEDHPPPPPTSPLEAQAWKADLRQFAPLRPLPQAADLPVVVAARLSLSFPLLISAVPLWAVSVTRTKTTKARTATCDVHESGGKGSIERAPKRCWFSDGGISSNFPIHFFDTPLPRRPTFAINLSGFRPGHPQQADEAQNVWLPEGNESGALSEWYPFDTKPGNTLIGFANAIVRTMQNRVDSALMRQPGYRDRIAHVHLDDRTEGGLNLNMDKELLKRLSERGQVAGKLLAGRFGPDSTDRLDWNNHRWVRYRALLSALVPFLNHFAQAWKEADSVGQPYPALARRSADSDPRSYRWGAKDAELGQSASDTLADLGSVLDRDPQPLSRNTPNPPAQIRVSPTA